MSPPPIREPVVKIDLSQARLEDAREFPGCVLMLGCEICGWSKGYDVGKVISRLYQLRDGGFQTPVSDVARAVKHLCPNCKGRHWSSQFAYPADLDERERKYAAQSN